MINIFPIRILHPLTRPLASAGDRRAARRPGRDRGDQRTPISRVSVWIDSSTVLSAVNSPAESQRFPFLYGLRPGGEARVFRRFEIMVSRRGLPWSMRPQFLCLSSATAPHSRACHATAVMQLITSSTRRDDIAASTERSTVFPRLAIHAGHRYLIAHGAFMRHAPSASRRRSSARIPISLADASGISYLPRFERVPITE